MSAGIRLIADAMLGRLARWLRLIGVDTLYYPDIEDNDLLRLAMRKGRVILTRDTHFLRMKNLKDVFFVHSEKPVEQFREVIAALGLKEFGPGRCAACNGRLETVGEKAHVRDMVPEYVFLNCSTFLQCDACGTVYWEGTHLKRFRELLNQLKDS